MKIGYFVLTYNRLELVKRTIEAVRNQTYKDFDIFVVNNGSIDGTKEWLETQPDITAITVEKNIGAAYGFYIGVQELYNRGYDWIWMMDDDGTPDENQLNQLIEKSLKYNLEFANALVLYDETTRLFPSKNEKISDRKNLEIILDDASPFNGTLIKRSVIEKAGNIRPEFYLWGCESEFFGRVKMCGAKIATVTQAIQIDKLPTNSTVKSHRKHDYVIPWVKKVRMNNYEHNDMWFMVRNNGYIHKYYVPIAFKIKYILKHILCYIPQCKFIKLFKFFRCYFEGRNNIVGKDMIKISDPYQYLEEQKNSLKK